MPHTSTQGGRLLLTTGPAAEPILLADAKRHLRVEGSDDDAAIDLAIERARVEAETIMARALINQTWTLKLDFFPPNGEIKLPRPPLSSVTSVKYTDTDGVEQTFSSSDYVVDLSGEIGRLYLAWESVWPSVRLENNAVRVEFVAGYGAAGTAVPATFRAWMLMRIGDHYAHREGTVTGTIATPLEFVDKLLAEQAVLF